MNGFVTSFCAICTDDTGPFVRRPLGRDDALVVICESCDTETPRVRGATERGYEPTGGMLSTVEVTRGSRTVMGDAEYEKQVRLDQHAGMCAPPSAQQPDTAPQLATHIARGGRRL